MPTFDSAAAYGTVSGETPGGIKYEQGGELFKADGTHRALLAMCELSTVDFV